MLLNIIEGLRELLFMYVVSIKIFTILQIITRTFNIINSLKNNHKNPLQNICLHF